MNDQSPPPGSPLETIRAEIDSIDKSLLSLLAERLRVVDKLNGLKAPEQGLPIRPGREVALLRRLVAEAPAPLDREFVVEIWRAMIAASVRRQRVIDVVVGGGRNDPSRLFDIARRHFGARTRISHVGEPQVGAAKSGGEPAKASLQLRSWPAAPGVGSWWPALSERRFHDLHHGRGLAFAWR